MNLFEQLNTFIANPKLQPQGQRFGQAFHDYVNPQPEEGSHDQLWWNKIYNEPNRGVVERMVNDRHWSQQ